MGLTNNDILKKIRVALKLRDDDIVRILGHVDYEITKGELGAFFRAEEHAKYMELQDQILRNFLNGLVIEKRGIMERKNRKKTLRQERQSLKLLLLFKRLRLSQNENHLLVKKAKSWSEKKGLGIRFIDC